MPAKITIDLTSAGWGFTREAPSRPFVESCSSVPHDVARLLQSSDLGDMRPVAFLFRRPERMICRDGQADEGETGPILRRG